MNDALLAARAELKRAWPLALTLALGLGAVLVVGANLSNAYPSQDHPFGWSGPSSFENGVAMVRSDLVLATSVPALFLGVRALRTRDPQKDAPTSILAIFALDAMLLFLAVTLAATVGALGASRTTPLAFVAFAVAHTLLALSFYALGFLASAVARRRGAAAIGIGVWVLFVSLWENATRWILFRQVGYDRLVNGEFPTWYYVSQAFSPLSLYRGTLILWDHRFMDYLEKAILGKAVLPDWMNPGTFALASLLMWVAVPLGIATLVWWWQGRQAAKATRARAPEAA